MPAQPGAPTRTSPGWAGSKLGALRAQARQRRDALVALDEVGRLQPVEGLPGLPALVEQVRKGAGSATNSTSRLVVRQHEHLLGLDDVAGRGHAATNQRGERISLITLMQFVLLRSRHARKRWAEPCAASAVALAVSSSPNPARASAVAASSRRWRARAAGGAVLVGNAPHAVDESQRQLGARLPAVEVRVPLVGPASRSRRGRPRVGQPCGGLGVSRPQAVEQAADSGIERRRDLGGPLASREVPHGVGRQGRVDVARRGDHPQHQPRVDRTRHLGQDRGSDGGVELVITWSPKKRRTAGTKLRAWATARRRSGRRSGRSARAASASAFDRSSSGNSVADMTQPIWSPMRAAACSERSSGWATCGGVSGRLPKKAASMASDHARPLTEHPDHRRVHVQVAVEEPAGGVGVTGQLLDRARRCARCVPPALDDAGDPHEGGAQRAGRLRGARRWRWSGCRRE